MSSKHMFWIDYVKVFACILVVLGHFFQSMVKASIIPDNELYQWFNNTIYYFHVPLFFICSGYLYQKYSKVDSLKSWENNALKKALTLGVPYFLFSFITWLLKTVFSDLANDQIGGIGDVLFVHPTPPYWYLYILFFIFLFTPTVKEKNGMFAVGGVALILKFFGIIGGGILLLQIYVIRQLCANEIWFVLGMLLAFFDWQKVARRGIGVVLGLIFVIASLWTYKNSNTVVAFGMGLLACAAVFMIVAEEKEIKCLNWIAKYTMPIFLMHTLFAAPVSVVLMKIGVGVPVQVISGILISFAGPIVAMRALEQIKLDFLVFPGRLMKRLRRELQ